MNRDHSIVFLGIIILFSCILCIDSRQPPVYSSGRFRSMYQFRVVPRKKLQSDSKESLGVTLGKVELNMKNIQVVQKIETVRNNDTEENTWTITIYGDKNLSIVPTYIDMDEINYTAFNVHKVCQENDGTVYQYVSGGSIYHKDHPYNTKKCVGNRTTWVNTLSHFMQCYRNHVNDPDKEHFLNMMRYYVEMDDQFIYYCDHNNHCNAVCYYDHIQEHINRKMMEDPDNEYDNVDDEDANHYRDEL